MPILKEVIAELSKLDPDDFIHINWITKDHIVEELIAQEYTDENDKPYEKDFIEKEVDNDFVDMLDNDLQNDDRLWEIFIESMRDSIKDIFDKKVETDIDKELWD